MKQPSAKARQTAVARARLEARRARRKKIFSYVLMGVAALIVLAGIQALAYYLYFIPQVDEVNARYAAFMQERTELAQQTKVQDGFKAVIEELKPEEAYARQVLEQFEDLVKLFRQTPREVAEEVHDALLTMSEKFKADGEANAKPLLVQAAGELQTLAADIDKLREIYTINFEDVQSKLDTPPMYFWPTGNFIRYRTGYLSAIIFNRAMYLSQIGETGTARVLLTGLYASTTDEKMKSMVYYGLGRLQWELFTTLSEPEHYFQSLKYMRQSMQSDPAYDMPKQVLDFMLSLDQGDSVPRAGEGDPSNPSEGQAASEPEITPLF